MLVKYMSLSVFCHQLLAKPGDRTLSLLPLSVLSLPFQEQLSLLCTKAALLASIQQLNRSYRTPPYCVTGRPLSGRQGAAANQTGFPQGCTLVLVRERHT